MSELGMKVSIILGLPGTILEFFSNENRSGAMWLRLMAEYHLGGRGGYSNRYGAEYPHASALRLSPFARTLDKKMAYG